MGTWGAEPGTPCLLCRQKSESPSLSGPRNIHNYQAALSGLQLLAKGTHLFVTVAAA